MTRPHVICLIAFFVDMRLKRRLIAGSVFVVPLPSIRHASRFGNSFGSRFNSHKLHPSRPFAGILIGCMFQATVIKQS